LLSCSGMGISMLAMAAGLHLEQLASLSSVIAITGTVAYMVFFALGAGPVPGLLVPEVTPARLRGKSPWGAASAPCIPAACWCSWPASGCISRQGGLQLTPLVHACLTSGLSPHHTFAQMKLQISLKGMRLITHS
jgi:hypothetical protein